MWWVRFFCDLGFPIWLVCDSLEAGIRLRGRALIKPRDERQKNLLRPAPDQIIDLCHALVRLAQEIGWGLSL